MNTPARLEDGFINAVSAHIADSLLCRKCGHDITVAANLDNKASKLALRQRNDTILGVQECLIQLFKNPHGIFLPFILPNISF